MQFMVKGADGNEYGPADVDTLKLWAVEGRLDRQTMLRDFNTGVMTAAGSVTGIFPPAAAPLQAQPPGGNGSQPPPNHYQRPGTPAAGGRTYGGEGYGFILAIAMRCGLALFLA